MDTHSGSTPPPSVVGIPHPSRPHRHPTKQRHGTRGHHAVLSSPSMGGSAPQGTLQIGSVPLHWRAHATSPLQHPICYLK